MMPSENSEDQESEALSIRQEDIPGLLEKVKEDNQARGNYDASALKQQRPHVYSAVATLVEDGLMSFEQIRKACQVSWETVAAVALDLGPDSIREGKRRTVAKLSVAITVGFDSLIQRFKEGHVSAIDLAVLIDKRELLTGGVTERQAATVELSPEVRRFHDLLENGIGGEGKKAKGKVIDADSGEEIGTEDM